MSLGIPPRPPRLLGALGRPDGEESPGAHPAIVVHVVDAALGGVRQLRRSAWGGDWRSHVPTKEWFGWYVIFLVILIPFVRSCCCIATSWSHAYTAYSSKCCQWSKFMRWIHALRDLELNGQLPPTPVLFHGFSQLHYHAAKCSGTATESCSSAGRFTSLAPASAKLKRGNWEDQTMKPSFSATLSKASQHRPISGSICLYCDNELPYRTEISCMHGIIIVLLCAYYSVSPEYGSTMIPKSLRALCTKPLQSEIRRLQSVTFGVAPPNYYILIICINLLLKWYSTSWTTRVY